MSDSTLVKYRPPRCELNKNDTNGHTKLDKKKPRRVQSYTKNFRQLRKAGSKRDVLPREEPTNWLSNAKWSVLKTYKYVAL